MKVPKDPNPARHNTDRSTSTQGDRVKRGVIGILSRGSALLLIRRALGIPRGGTWCFPGGHVEPEETPRRAVQRELSEELGITVIPTVRLRAIRLPELGYVLAVWCVRHTSGHLTPAPAEIAEIRWLTPPQIRTLDDALPSNLEILKRLGV